MSLISAFMIKVNSRTLAPSVLASAAAAASRTRPSESCSLPSSGSRVSSSPVEGKPQRGDRLVEQPVPRRGARHRLFEEQLLELVAELVRPLLADVDQPRTIMGERRILSRRVEPSVVEPVELELEEQQLAGELGHLLLRVAEELGARRIAGVAGVKQRSVGHDAAHQVLQLFVGADRLEQARTRFGALRQLGELALIGRGEALRFRGGARKVGGEARRIHALVEVVEAPLRQRPEVDRGRRGGRGSVRTRARPARRRRPRMRQRRKRVRGQSCHRPHW